MSERPWYKRYPSDFIAGALGLTAEQKGVYSTLLDLMYDRGAPIADEPVELGRICGCSTRRFNIIKGELLERRKIVLRDGMISNPRFERQMPAEKSDHDRLSESGARGAEKAAENARNFPEKTAENRTIPSEKSEIKQPRSNPNKDLGKKEPPSQSQAYQSPERVEGERDTRARVSTSTISPEAHALSDQFLTAIGIDPEHPELWGMTGAPYSAAMWIARGYDHPLILATAADIAARQEPGEKQKNLNYYTSCFETAHKKACATRQREMPLLQTLEGGSREAATSHNRAYSGPRGFQPVADPIVAGLARSAARRAAQREPTGSVESGHEDIPGSLDDPGISDVA